MFRGMRLFGASILLLVVPVLAQAELEPACYPVFQITCDTVQSGRTATACIVLEGARPMKGLDLLIEYDASRLNFVEARQVGGLSGWEYFQYRDSVSEGCPEGLIRVVADADTANHLPTGCIVELEFTVSLHRAPKCGCVDLRFAWHDCGDNLVRSLDGDTMYFAYNIRDLLPGQKCLKHPGDLVPVALNRFMDGCICIEQAACEREGDLNNDNRLNLVDIVYWIDYVFRGGPEPIPGCECGAFCRADFNCDGRLNLVDIAALARYFFRQPAPRPCER